jgi:hypothetical protein
MSSLQKEPKIYGAVESQSYITFTGFCKRIYDTTQQSVDVFVDDAKIDTIVANQKIADIENKYEVFDTNGFCFTYTLPKEYIGQKHKLEFKTKDGEQLVHSPIITIDSSNEKYNEYTFIESLNEPIDEEKIKDMYCPNSIGFLATKENLEDEEFVEYIKELMIRFPDVEFKGFYTNLQDIKNQKDNLKFIQFIAICDIKDVIQDIEIFIFNNYKVNLEVQLFSKIRESCKNILAFHSNFSIPNYKSLTIKEVEKYWEEHLNKLINNFKRLGFEKNDISQDKSYYKSYSNVLYRKFNLGNPIISLEQSAYEYWNFKTIEYALSNKEFKEFFFNLVLGQIDIYNGNNK